MDDQPLSSRLTALGSSLVPQPPSVAAGPGEQSKRDTSFYSDHVIFKVGNHFFKVPRRKFEDDSDIFRGIHYGPSIDEQREPTLEEWISILKLTTMWHFHGLRRTAIDRLTPLVQDGDPIQWIVLARKYDVHEWLLPALNALARRPRALQLHEVNSLGIATVVKMAEVRESFNEQGSYRHSSREDGNFEGEIQRLFADELPREPRCLADDSEVNSGYDLLVARSTGMHRWGKRR
ncbi:hypothetical protein C8Q74DRAFT_1294525 [Fomes fomentarius]|nr:hypothetical protein C8Q74DRAFT_1294525 [Fomes fomentarius]